MEIPKKVLCFAFRCLLALTISSPVYWGPIALAQGRSYAIQIASPTSEAEARTIVDDLRSKGVEAYVVKSEVPGKGTRYRVRIGRFNNQAAAKSQAESSLNQGLFAEYIVTIYEKATPTTTAKTAEAKARPSEIPKLVQPDAAKIARVEPAREIAITPPASNQPKEMPPAAPPAAKVPEKSPEPGDARSESVPENSLIADAPVDLSIGNSNWKVVQRNVETDKNLRAIYFVDGLTGWAAGDAGAVYRTTDGGRSWKPLLCGASANISHIYFVDWNTGWMIGEIGGNEEASGETTLFRTTNGGRTWSRKQLPNVLSLYFVDTNNGWAVGKDATLLKTIDGGEQWTPIEGIEKLIGLPVESSNYNYGFRDIHFINPDQGWMIGNFYGRARSNIGGLFVTSDGGRNWKRLPITLQTQFTSGRFTPGEFHSVRFTDANTGSVTGEMQDGEGKFFFVLHTRDGGKTWEQFRKPSRATHHTQFLNVANGWSAAFAPREGSADAVVYDTTLMRTDNGGMSWQNDFVARGRRIRNLFFISPTRGWAVGDRGMILRYEENRDR